MFGAIGGVISSMVMYPFLFLTTSMMGIPLDDLSIARGMAISNDENNNYFNLVLGIGLHLLTGAVAGMIFVFMINTINRFKITSFRKGIGEGIIWSIIIFIILYIPTTINMVQPNLFEIMHQSNPYQNSLQNQRVVEQNLFPLYGFGFIAHIVFGSTLGYLVSLLVLRDNTILKR